jgi:hypothetical protein
VRITSKRPKIVKLHGDFLFDNIKNTVRELETLEDNMKNKLRQFASEFGFVFLGYSGNDRSVMDVINTLVRSEGYFPHGIYWCVRKGEQPSPSLRELAKNPKVCLIEVPGFDEFCVELHTKLDLSLQDEVRDPYRSLTSRLNTLLDRTKFSKDGDLHPKIQQDIGQLAHRLSASRKEGDNTASSGNVPLLLLAQVAQQKEQYDVAFSYSFDELRRSNSQRSLELAFASGLKTEDTDQIHQLIDYLDSNSLALREYPNNIHTFVVELLYKKKFELVMRLLTIAENNFGPNSEDTDRYDWSYHLINKGQTFRHQNMDLPEDLRESLKYVVSSTTNPFAKFGALLVLGNEDSAINQVREFSSHGGHSLEDVLRWPIADLFSNEAKARLLSEYQVAVRGAA